MNDEIKVESTYVRETEDGWEIDVRFKAPKEFIEINVQPEPEPVLPEWRRLVDAADGDPDCRPYDSPLASVLDHLSKASVVEDLAAEGRKAALARIVAVCEAQVGDGWQADPSGWAATPYRHALLKYLSVPEKNGWRLDTDWRGLGDAAAAWLRDLTKADA